MDKLEKAEFLLEQVRLCLVNKDFVRASIVAKKVDRKVIRAEDFQTVKLKYVSEVSACAPTLVHVTSTRVLRFESNQTDRIDSKRRQVRR